MRLPTLTVSPCNAEAIPHHSMELNGEHIMESIQLFKMKQKYPGIRQTAFPRMFPPALFALLINKRLFSPIYIMPFYYLLVLIHFLLALSIVAMSVQCISSQHNYSVDIQLIMRCIEQ